MDTMKNKLKKHRINSESENININTFVLVLLRHFPVLQIQLSHSPDDSSFASVSLNSTEAVFLVASSRHPREDVRNKSGVSARKSRGCYEETAVVECRLYRRCTHRGSAVAAGHLTR